MQVHASLDLLLGTVESVEVGLSLGPDNDTYNGQDLDDDDGSVLSLPLCTGEGECRNASHTTEWHQFWD